MDSKDFKDDDIKNSLLKVNNSHHEINIGQNNGNIISKQGK
jgi:hypothetical protein